MNTKDLPLHASPVLKDIISTYADLWADVMFSKNLEKHLIKIESDLDEIDHIIAVKESEGKDHTAMDKVANQLYCLKMIVLKKLKLRL